MNKGLLIALGGAVVIGLILVFSKTASASTGTPLVNAPGTVVTNPANTGLSGLLAGLFGTGKAVGTPVIEGTLTGSALQQNQTGQYLASPVSGIAGGTTNEANVIETGSDVLYGTDLEGPSYVSLTNDPLSDTISEPSILDDPSTLSLDSTGDYDLGD